MAERKRRVLTGARPSGLPHLGNYYGAFKPLLELQESYDLFFFLADLHALNGSDSAAELRQQSMVMMATLLACGLDPTKSLLYAQSAVPEVCELAWILGCQAPFGMLTRAHSYKDAVAKGLDVNMGVFNYPVLMAADILLFDADVVPVGQDQKQHLEMTRDFAQRFNHRYGQVLHLPEPKISDELALVPGTDGEKMSKSKHNVVSVFATDADWKRQVMSIVTGTQSLAEAKDPDACTVFTLYKLLSAAPEAAAMAERYRAGGYGFGHAKAALIDQLKLVFGPMRELYFDWLKRPDDMRDLLLRGSSDARRLAQRKLEQVQAAVGVIGRPF